MDGSESYTDENAWLATGMQQNAPAGTPSAASASPTAHMRGLTSTLSGRRTRHEPTPASSGPEVPVAAAAVAPRADMAGRQAHADSYSPHVSPQQAWRPLGRREARGFRGVDSDDEGGQPPASLLVELPHQYGSVAGSRGSAQASVLLEDPRQGGAGGFVRRAAQAVQTRIQDIGGQAAGLPQLGGPMPPPHPRTRDTGRGSGDGRPPLGAGARTAWPRRGGRQRAEARPTHRERALRAWRDVRHQDGFFCRVYAYYAGKGALTIIVSRVLQLATLAFVVVLSTFVFGCIDHAKVRDQKSLAAVVIPQCTRQLSWMATLALWSFAAFWAAQVARMAMDVPQLLEMRAFFEEVLGVPAADMGTVAWHEVVGRMVRLRDAEIREYQGMTRSRILSRPLTADGVVNRIMRRENYMLALFNKDLLDISIPGLGRRQVLTKALEWNLSFCLMNYLFDERGQLRRRFLKESNRAILSEGLRRRFRFMAVINMLFAPFIVVFLVLYSFFRYFEELYHEPGTLMSRAFTPYARCKFRNFNEVPHSFRRRLDSAHAKATLYLAQFRNDALIATARFVSFVAGSFAALLLAFTVVDNELSLEFEITRHRTVLFYIGLSSAVLAAARGMVPTDHQEYLHPAWIMRDVLEDLQYMEPAWRGRLDTTRVRREFEVLFSYRLLIFAHELLGVVTAPFIMLFSLPGCAEQVVDFFREFTVHREGLGYVCSFAAFDLENHGNVRFSAPTRTGGERMASKNGKMEQSFLAFKADYPEWTPRTQAGSIYLQRAQHAQQDLWRAGGAGWQDRLLQQQRMAGSVLPTGASLYRSGRTGAPAATAATAAATTARSQVAFQPPGFANVPPLPRPPLQQPHMPSVASQAMLPFGPTLGPALGTVRGEQPGRLPTVDEHGGGSDTGRLALSSLPLVASPRMGASTGFPAALQPGTFSILNELYEQQVEHD